MATFKKGDLVQLKSGGPIMTVEVFLEYNEEYRCQWFAGAKLNSGDFPPESLVSAELLQKPSPKKGG